jgi:hypothetical protein
LDDRKYWGRPTAEPEAISKRKRPPAVFVRHHDGRRVLVLAPHLLAWIESGWTRDPDQRTDAERKQVEAKG